MYPCQQKAPAYGEPINDKAKQLVDLLSAG